MNPGSEQIRIRGSSSLYTILQIVYSWMQCEGQLQICTSWLNRHVTRCVNRRAARPITSHVTRCVTRRAARRITSHITRCVTRLVASLATSLANLQRYRQHKTHLVRSPEAGATIWGLFCYITASDVIIFKFQGFNCTPLHLSAGAHVDARFVWRVICKNPNNEGTAHKSVSDCLKAMYMRWKKRGLQSWFGKNTARCVFGKEPEMWRLAQLVT